MALENGKEAFGNAATQARQAAEDYGRRFNRMAGRAQSRAEDVFDQAQDAFAEGQGRAKQFVSDAGYWVQSNPWQVVAIVSVAALAVTLLIRSTRD